VVVTGFNGATAKTVRRRSRRPAQRWL